MYKSILLSICCFYAVFALLPDYQFVNDYGEILPKGTSRPAGLAGPGRYYRKTDDDVRIGYVAFEVEAIIIKNLITNQTFENNYGSAIYEWSAKGQKYIQIAANSTNGPAGRSFPCACFDKRTNRIYMFGGTNAPVDINNISPSNIFRDLWAYDLDFNSWVLLNQTGNLPGDRASMGCGCPDHKMVIYSGASFDSFFINGDFNPNDAYRLNLPATKQNTLSWTQIRPYGNPNFPTGRTQTASDLIPTTHKVVFRGGDRFNLTIGFHPITQNDIFTYDLDTDTVDILDNFTSPFKVTQDAVAALSPRWVLFQNGDNQGNLTTNQTCPFPNECFVPNTPTNFAYLYDLVREKFIKVPFNGIPPTRRSTLGAYVETEKNDKFKLLDKYFSDGDIDSNDKVV